MPLQGCHTLSRRASRSLGELSLELYMMRMLDESLSGSSVPSWLETLSGFRSLPSYMVPRDLVSQRSSIFWRFSSKATQLHLMRELLDQSQISSRPALSARVRSWPSTRMETYLESSPMDSSTALLRTKLFSSMRRGYEGILSESMQSYLSEQISQSRSQIPSQVSSVDLSTSPLPGTNWTSVSIKLS